MEFDGRSGLLFFIAVSAQLGVAFALQVIGFVLSVDTFIEVDSIKGYISMALCLTSTGCFVSSRFLQGKIVSVAIYLKVVAQLSVFVAGVFGMFAVKRGAQHFHETMEVTPFPVGYFLFGLGSMFLFPATVLISVDCMITSNNNKPKTEIE